jgi:polyphenol oxidase
LSVPFFKDSDGLFRCPEFERFARLRHGFGTRDAASYYAEHPVTTLRQIHSDIVVDAHHLEDRAREGDSLVSADSGKRIGVRTADCVPILMADPATRSVAAVHAGWRGTVAGIAERTAECLVKTFGAGRSDLHVAFGPSIRSCCYEVGPEVASQFDGILDESTETGARRHIDLVEANRRMLIQAGIRAEQIFDSGLCTFCLPEEFFSYRRQPQDPGRMLSFIEIVNNL